MSGSTTTTRPRHSTQPKVARPASQPIGQPTGSPPHPAGNTSLQSLTGSSMSLPPSASGRFTRDVVQHTINPAHFINNSRGNLCQQKWGNDAPSAVTKRENVTGEVNSPD